MVDFLSILSSSLQQCLGSLQAVLLRQRLFPEDLGSMAPPCTNKEDMLNGTNYAHWRLQLKVWFIHTGLWKLVQGFEKKLEWPRTLRSGPWIRRMHSRRIFRIGMNEIQRHTLSWSGFLQRKSFWVSKTLISAAEVWSKLEDPTP